MKPISGIDAIAPAIRRTRAVLGQPLRLGFFLKLVIVATFSGGNLIAMGILLPMQASSLLFQFLMARNGSASGSSPNPLAQLSTGSLSTAFFLGVAAFVVIYLLLCVVFFYFFTRFRFVVFDAVLFRERKFGPAWRKYGAATLRYYGLSILIAMACMLVATAIASPIILISLRAMQAAQAAGSSGTDSMSALGPTLGYFVVSVLLEYSLLFIAAVIDGLMRDFLMPPMAVEGASIERSFAGLVAVVRQDPAGVFVFTLLRFALRMALALGLMILLIIPIGILALILFAVGALLYHPLWNSGLGGQVVLGVYAFVSGFVTLVLYLLAIFTVGGIVAVFTQAYALIFFADRYPPLGRLLNPPPPPAVQAILESQPEPESVPAMPPPFLPEPPALW